MFAVTWQMTIDYVAINRYEINSRVIVTYNVL